ncbi:hypothetical protein JW823_05925 [bacterium]|nr:hypothetical protein [candidate division CSSED10-310 bacterium]
MSQKKLQKYLDNILSFLKLDFGDMDALVKAIADHETEDRVQYDGEKHVFRLGMATWTEAEMVDALTSCREAVVSVLDKVVLDGMIGREELENLNKVHHDLHIQYVFDPDTPTRLNLNYIIPDGKIAWETGMCPHCGEGVTIHLFPDPMPVIGYEAIINALRLVTRSVKLAGSAVAGYTLVQH